MTDFYHEFSSILWWWINTVEDSCGERLWILEYFSSYDLILVEAEAANTFYRQNIASTDQLPCPLNQKSMLNPGNNVMPEDLLLFYCRFYAYDYKYNWIQHYCTCNFFCKYTYFTWTRSDIITAYNGPITIHLLVMAVNPSTWVGILNLKDVICITRFIQFLFNIIDLCDKTIVSYLLIGKLNVFILSLSTSVTDELYKTHQIWTMYKLDYYSTRIVYHPLFISEITHNFNNLKIISLSIQITKISYQWQEINVIHNSCLLFTKRNILSVTYTSL